MPKVVPRAKLSEEEPAADDAVAVVDVEVPPLPPILLPNNDEIATASDGEEGVIEHATKEATDNPANKDDDDDDDGENNNHVEQPTFYAVRVGYACLNCPSSSTKTDGAAAADAASPSPSGNGRSSSHVSTIRSAIFLRWEDVKQFVEFEEPPPPPAAAAASAATGAVNVPFHHNVEYKEFTDMEIALKYLQQVTPPSTNKHWWNARSIPRSSNKLPVKSFNPPTKKWEAMYQASLDFKAKYGHINILSHNVTSEQEYELVKWVKYQRSSYKSYLEDNMGRNHAMTSTKVYRLKEAGFDWIVDDKNKTSPNAETGKRKRGRPRKSEAPLFVPSPPKKKNKKESLSRNRPIRQKWLEMLESLKQYKTTHGTVSIPEDDNSEEHKELKLWGKTQRANYIRWKAGADVGMTQEKADLLIELGMEFAPSWDEMFAQVVAYKAQHGHINVTSEEDAALASWMSKQNFVLGRHLNGMTTRLKKEQISRLVNVGFEGGRKKFVNGDMRVEGSKTGGVDFDAKWDLMFGQLQDYKSENGHCNVPTSAGSDLSNWVAAQRRMYGKLISGKPGKRSFLDASKMQRLTELGFQFRPRGSYYSWEEQMVEVRKYKEENGDCKIPVNHERLGSFVKLVRREHKKYLQGKKCGMTAVKEAELKELGFVFEGGKTPERRVTQPKSWEERYQDLIRYKDQNGDTVVPQNSGRLGQWVHAQRVHYKRFKRGEPSQMTAEKALKLSEIGFCFDAAERFRGSRIGSRVSTIQRPMDVEEVQGQISDVAPALNGSFY